MKAFYDEVDYEVVIKLLHGIKVSEEDIERVKTRQLFLRGITNNGSWKNECFAKRHKQRTLFTIPRV